ncbi:MAG: defense against restriction DarA-related protein [Methylobacter sp.]
MNPKNLLFSFGDLSIKDKAAKKAMQYFSRAGANVVAQDVDPKVKRTNGISYREMTLTFADSQIIGMRIKQSGDIYQVLLNGKVVPIKSQDDHVAAIAELVKMLDAGRTKFQAKLAKIQVKLPPSIKSAVPTIRKQLEEKRDGLKAAIDEVLAEIAVIRGGAASA